MTKNVFVRYEKYITLSMYAIWFARSVILWNVYYQKVAIKLVFNKVYVAFSIYCFNKLTWNIQLCFPCVLFYIIKPGLSGLRPNYPTIWIITKPGYKHRRSQTAEEALS